MSIDPSAFGYDPFMGTSYFNSSGLQALNQAATSSAQAAYQNAQAQLLPEQFAFQQAQQAFSNAMSLGSAYGYAPGGNWYQYGAGGATIPPAGTPLQSTMNTMGYAGGIPGLTGYNTGQTLSATQAYAQMAQNAAGLTGFYNAPGQSQYSPGTFLRIDPSTYPSQYGTQLDYVTPSGQLQRVSTSQAQAMGWNGNLGSMNVIPYSTAATLESAPPSNVPQQTLAGQQAYQAMNASAQQQALATSGATGMYTAPGQILAPGTNAQGGKFSDLDPATQQAYYYAHGGDWQAAMNAWVSDSNAAIQQAYASAGGQGTAPGLTTPGTPTETMAAQQQYFNQAQNLASQFGQYYAPGAPGQAAQPGVNAPAPGQETLAYQQFQQQAAQSYLQLLSQLQGPADYGQYLKTLGSTPAGLQGLVGAAAGQYIPGGGTTGIAPQAQTLNNLVGAATNYTVPGTTGNPYATSTSTVDQLTAAASGQGGGGTGANAAGGAGGAASPGGMNYSDFLATAQGLPAPSQIAPQSFNQMLPSQQQMLGSMYSNLGYAPGDINKMYQQSLPKYAAGSAAGSMRLV